MKKLTIFLLLALLVRAQAQKVPDIPRLSGIVNLPGLKEAVLEFPSRSWDGPRQLILREGEQGFWGLKVIRILPDRRAAEIAVEGTQAALTLSVGATAAPEPGAITIELADASLQSVLQLYAELSQKTPLLWPTLSAANFSLKTSTTNRMEAAAALQRALTEKQITAIQDGDKFMMIVPRDQVSAIKPHPAGPNAAIAPAAEPPTGDIPPGEIRFHSTAIEQVFMVYAELIGARFTHDGPRPKPIQPYIFLCTGSPLSKDEAIYAFDTLFAWQGITMARQPDGSVRPVQKLQK